jgi:hypothetical protein
MKGCSLPADIYVATSRTSSIDYPVHIDTAADGDDRNDRETIRPSFDPQDFARQSERLTMRPDADTPSETPEIGNPSMVVELLPVQETSVPKLAVGHEDLEWFDISPAARRMLEYIDGAASLEVICIRMGLPLIEGMDAIDVLVHEGLVVCG